MKKTIIALATAICCAASAFALSACGGNGGGNGNGNGGNGGVVSQQLSKEEWIAAFDNMKTINSVTMTLEGVGMGYESLKRINKHDYTKVIASMEEFSKIEGQSTKYYTFNIGNRYYAPMYKYAGAELDDIEEWNYKTNSGNMSSFSDYELKGYIALRDTITYEQAYSMFSYNAGTGKYEGTKEYIDAYNALNTTTLTYFSITFRNNYVYSFEAKEQYSLGIDGEQEAEAMQTTATMTYSDINSTSITISPELKAKLDAAVKAD